MDLVCYFILGVDIWMNIFMWLVEVLGMLGEKVLMNGVFNFFVLDGWWYEGYCKDVGWVLIDKRIYQNEQY